MRTITRIPVLDLFCGMGGLSVGFARNGFQVTGYDLNPQVPEIFRLNGIGSSVLADLGRRDPILPDHHDVRVVIGGPPCRPWSVLNLHRPGPAHPDYHLVRAFFRILLRISPDAFLMENVPALAMDHSFRRALSTVSREYETEFRTVRYSDFGAATARRRLIVVGFRRRSRKGSRATEFFDRLERLREPPRPVIEVLKPYAEIPRGGFPDHEWPDLRTIPKYLEKYRNARFGWYHLRPDRPAPSFGNIRKTYILHPFSMRVSGFPIRVLSIREAMAIMGFPDDFRFPKGMGLGSRYQMVADAVSPVFSEKCARVMLELL